MKRCNECMEMMDFLLDGVYCESCLDQFESIGKRPCESDEAKLNTKEDKDVRLILSLLEQTKEFGSNVIHFTANNIQRIKEITAVTPVYDNLKPANMVLDELYDWAVESNKEVNELIEKLEVDMDWNEEIPV